MRDIKFNKGPRYIRAYKLDGKYRDAFAFYDRKYRVWFDAYNWLKPSHVQTPKSTADYLDTLLVSDPQVKLDAQDYHDLALRLPWRADCEFEQLNPHEWHCSTHNVTKIAGTKEPVNCS